MEKKTYSKPSVDTFDIQVQNIIAGSPVNSVGGNAFSGTVTGGNGPGLAPGRNMWNGGWDD